MVGSDRGFDDVAIVDDPHSLTFPAALEGPEPPMMGLAKPSSAMTNSETNFIRCNICWGKTAAASSPMKTIR